MEEAATKPLLGVQQVVLGRLASTGRKTINGFAEGYNSMYPLACHGVVSAQDFTIAINAINQTAQDFMPCCFCRFVAYVISILTLGLSLWCCGDPCTKELEVNLGKVLNRINRNPLFESKGIQWELKRTMCHTWIEIYQDQYHHETV